MYHYFSWMCFCCSWFCYTYDSYHMVFFWTLRSPDSCTLCESRIKKRWFDWGRLPPKDLNSDQLPWKLVPPLTALNWGCMNPGLTLKSLPYCISQVGSFTAPDWLRIFVIGYYTMDPFYIGRLSWIIMIISSSLKRKSPLKLYGKRPQTVRGGGVG